MRCEVCGAPFAQVHDETRCLRCREKEAFGRTSQSATPVAPLQRSSRPDSASSASSPPPLSALETIDSITSTTAGYPRVSRRHISVRPQAASEAPAVRVELPLPDDAERSSVLPSSVVLEGKYRLLNELGRGAMGTVFMAEDLMLKRKVAVKFLLPELADSVECAVRFKREAIAMAAIRNENVAQIFAYGEDAGTPYFVMEYLDGETVENLIDSHNRRGFFVPVEDATDIMIYVLYGLSAIHRADAVHRDIKPANIMLTIDPMRAVIMDFGLVRDVQLEDDMRTLAGTPAYIAPELVEGRPDADRSPLVDIYSLGTTFYELITGSIPFGGDSWVEILQKHIAEMPVHPSVRRPGLPEAFDEVILRAMSKDPRERYQSSDDFLDDLIALRDMVSEQATPSGRAATRPARRSGAPTAHRKSTPSRNRISTNPHGAFRSTPSGARGRLLVADESEPFRTEVMNLAKSAVPGSRIYSAADGATALDMLQKLKPRVLIINQALPVVNGFEVVAACAGDPDFADMLIVVVSSAGHSQDAALLYALGVHHFFTTPVDMNELAEIIRPALEVPLGISSAPR
ncbi:MAG: protein kinase [Myxococcales bacterium]|nr:protein kinase [Myxococcales bacterium]